MIKMEHIAKSFNNKEVLSDINLNVNDGEIFGLLGPSGAGKTTILNILVGQLGPDKGDYVVNAPSNEIGLMLDEDGLYKRLTTYQNLELFANIYKVDKANISKALDSVGLNNDYKTPVAKLSTGMRQRLSLARAILHNPKVLFLDEPTSGLDPTTAKGIHQLLIDFKKQGKTVFLTTHNMDEAVDLCDHVALINNGKIVEYGSPESICEKYDSFVTKPDLTSVFIKVTGGNKNV